MDRAPLVDELSTEVRVRICKEVLESEYGLIPAHKKLKGEKRFEVPLLTTCKLIYAEAQDVFSEVNLIRFWRRSELDDAVAHNFHHLTFIRNVELVNVTMEFEWLSVTHISRILATCRGLPRLKTLTISFDPIFPKRNLRGLLMAAGGEDELRCIGVGVFSLGEGPVQIHWKHYGMVEAWSDVKTRVPASIDSLWAEERARYPLLTTPDHMLRWYVQLELGVAEFCSLFEMVRIPYPANVSVAEYTLLSELRRKISWLKPNALRELQELPGMREGLKLKDIDATKHDPVLIEWLTNFLALFGYYYQSIVSL